MLTYRKYIFIFYTFLLFIYFKNNIVSNILILLHYIIFYLFMINIYLIFYLFNFLYIYLIIIFYNTKNICLI